MGNSESKLVWSKEWLEICAIYYFVKYGLPKLRIKISYSAHK